MKNGLVTLGVFSLLSVAAMNAQASDGKITFTGEILDTACVVDTGSADQTIDLGTFAKTAFTGVGSESTGKPIEIKITSCPATITSAMINFDGKFLNGDNTAIALDDAVMPAVAATGVGIQIKDSTNTAMALDTDSSAYTLGTEGGTMTFYASYIQKAAAVTAGTANGSVQFSLNYN